MGFANRWLFGTNHQTIGTLYIIFSIFAGMIGTAFSMLIRMTLATPGGSFLSGGENLINVFCGILSFALIFTIILPSLLGSLDNIYFRVIISFSILAIVYYVLGSSQLADSSVQSLQGDNQLYNVIVTAHAFIMIFFLVIPGFKLKNKQCFSTVFSKSNYSSSTTDYSESNGKPEAPKHETHYFADPLNSRDKIRDITKGKPGVYVWTNVKNGKQYVGSSINLNNRIFSYFYPSIVASGTRYIYRALYKWGMINFTLTIHILPTESDLSTVLQLEQHYIDTLKPAYNILKVAGSSVGKPFSEENKQKFREERGTKIFVYNADGTQLLYVFLSRTQLFSTVHIDYTTLKAFLKYGRSLY